MEICKKFGTSSFLIIVSLLTLNVNFCLASMDNKIFKKKGFIIKNPQILYKDLNSKMITAYFEIKNTNSFDDKLLSVSGKISNNIQIHSTILKDGIMKMNKLNHGIEIKKNEILKFEHGGYHIMIMDLDEKIDEKVYVLNLNFEKSGKLSFTFEAMTFNKKLKMKHSH